MVDDWGFPHVCVSFSDSGSVMKIVCRFGSYVEISWIVHTMMIDPDKETRFIDCSAGIFHWNCGLNPYWDCFLIVGIGPFNQGSLNPCHYPPTNVNPWWFTGNYGHWILPLPHHHVIEHPMVWWSYVISSLHPRDSFTSIPNMSQWFNYTMNGHIWNRCEWDGMGWDYGYIQLSHLMCPNDGIMDAILFHVFAHDNSRDVPHCWTVGQSHPAQTPRIVRPSSKIHVWIWWLRTSQLETAWAPSVMLVVVGGHAMVWGDTVQSWYGFPVKLTLNHQNLRIWRFFCDFGPFSNPMIFVYIYYTDILIWIWISINHAARFEL